MTGETRLLIGGDWVEGKGASVSVLDKFALEPFASISMASSRQIDEAVDAADSTFKSAALSPHERGVILDRAALLIEGRREDFIRVMQAEAGFTLADAGGEFSRCVTTLKLSAEEARRFSGEIVPIEGAPGQAGRMAYTMRVPLGVVAAITPFNAPLNTVAHKVAPAIAAGNSVIIKPSALTPITSCMLAQVLRDAGLPAGWVSVVHAKADEAARLLADERVRFFAFTGSTRVGRIIQQAAGLRRTQMELGSIAFTILNDDADLDAALPKVTGAGFRKAGQVCTSVQHLLVQEALVDEVKGRFAELVSALAYGDPREEATVVGPLITEDDAKRVHEWIGEAIEMGAECLAGGGRDGAVVAPTLLANTTDDMRIHNTEVFGPVVCIGAFSTLEDAIARINSTPYGLATGAFTNRLSDAHRIARQVSAGSVHINETSSSRADLMPFGGCKDSGFGREGPAYAVREMSEERLVTIRF